MVETLCPEVARATSRDWSSARFPRLKRLIALGDRPGPSWMTWTDLEQGPHAPTSDLASRARSVRSTDVHNIQFTSGTTGLPKGAMLTHRNVLMNAFYTGDRLRYSAADRVCVPVPFYHCFGCVLGTMVCVVYGSAIVVPAPSFDAEATIAAIAAERCTAVYGVPTMFVSQLECPDLARCDVTSLRTGIMAGAPCPLPLMEKVISGMGWRDLHRLWPDGGLTAHHADLSRRPGRRTRRHGRAPDPGVGGQTDQPCDLRRGSDRRNGRALRPRALRDDWLLR
jgi:fatty-acyl-CoA synthase